MSEQPNNNPNNIDDSALTGWETLENMAPKPEVQSYPTEAEKARIGYVLSETIQLRKQSEEKMVLMEKLGFETKTIAELIEVQHRIEASIAEYLETKDPSLLRAVEADYSSANSLSNAVTQQLNDKLSEHGMINKQ